MQFEDKIAYGGIPRRRTNGHVSGPDFSAINAASPSVFVPLTRIGLFRRDAGRTSLGVLGGLANYGEAQGSGPFGRRPSAQLLFRRRPHDLRHWIGAAGQLRSGIGFGGLGKIPFRADAEYRTQEIADGVTVSASPIPSPRLAVRCIRNLTEPA